MGRDNGTVKCQSCGIESNISFDAWMPQGEYLMGPAAHPGEWWGISSWPGKPVKATCPGCALESSVKEHIDHFDAALRGDHA